MMRILILLLCTASAFAQDGIPVLRHSDTRPAHYAVPAISVHAPDNQTKVVMLRWARRLNDKIESRTGVPVNFNRRSIFIIIREEEGPADATSWQKFAHGEIQQTVVIRNLGDIERDRADAALCRIIMMGYLNPHWRRQETRSDYHTWIEDDVPSRVPRWICNALARELHSALRAEDGAITSKALGDGALPRLDAFCDRVMSDQRDSLQEAKLLLGMGTEIMGWLLSFEQPGPRFTSLTSWLAADKPFGIDWLLSAVPGVTSEEDLQAAWETWLSKHDLRILNPGVTRTVDVEQLAALTRVDAQEGFDPTFFGAAPPKTYADLATVRPHIGLDGFIVSRTHDLRVLALGRSPALAEVVDMYCDYLSSLRQGADRKKGLELLSQAEIKHAILRRDIME